MEDGLDRYNFYRSGAQALPARSRRWNLRGAGLGSLSLDTVDTCAVAPPDKLLVRHDACGICYSDVKIVRLGPSHPRLTGRDMQADPVVMGHEVSLTVVGVGAGLEARFAIGQRFIVQADIYFHGANLAYGYAIDGGMSEYGVIGEEVLAGDEGCYLLPIAETTGYAEAALVEPWACVVAAYRFAPRMHLLPAGSLLAIGCAAAVERALLEPFIRSSPAGAPRLVRTIDTFGGENLAARLDDQLGAQLFSDVVVIGTPSTADLACAAARLDRGGVLNIAAGRLPDGPVVLDIGRIHYDGLSIVGKEAAGGLATAIRNYTSNGRTDLAPGGSVWMIGAGGPMGQMHVQRAMLAETPPRKIVASDRQSARLQRLVARFQDTASRRGIALIAVHIGADQSRGANEIAAHGPYDDIVCMAASIDAVQEALPHLVEDGVFNLFAGVARGTTAAIDAAALIRRNQRLVGTSGSRLSDLVGTLEEVECGRLSTASSLAAVGGLDAYRDGLNAVGSGALAGKVVLFPHLRLGLTPLAELARSLPSVSRALAESGGMWSARAENALFKALL